MCSASALHRVTSKIPLEVKTLAVFFEKVKHYRAEFCVFFVFISFLGGEKS